jgi:dTDP-4-dehydrorhamnose reductase
MKRKIVILGAGGRLGAALQRIYRSEHEVLGFKHAQLDLAVTDQLRATLGAIDFDVLINCAAQTNVDRCETHPDEAFQLNSEAPRALAEICTGKNARLIHIGTDYVFDGDKIEPYTEDDSPNPISVYGASKLAGENHVLATDSRHVVARVSWVFGPDRPSFVDWAIAEAREKDVVNAVADKISTPTYTLEIANMLRTLFEPDAPTSGIIHLAGDGGCSWQEYAQWAIDCCVSAGVPLKARKVGAISLADMKNFVARRPAHTVLATDKYQRLTGHKPRHWRDAVAEYIRDYVQSRNS